MVAFTIAECIVEPSWARALVAGVETGAAGAGGLFHLSARAPTLARALFYLRYSAFMNASAGERRELAGDNACYRRDLLDRFADSFTDGFWEVEFHEQVRGIGGAFVMVEGGMARFAASPRFRDVAAARFAHGRHFGAWRVSSGARRRWQVILASPFVPPLLAMRIARRVLSTPGHGLKFLTSLPVLLSLAACWAQGEAIGAFVGVPANRTVEAAA